MRVLLGAVPFGENNIGDEAILQCVVSIVRSARPDAQLTVCTTDRAATERKFGVKTAPLFGFGAADMSLLPEVMAEHDVFIWSGATGLSDYPENAIELLEVAQAQGKKTIIWGVGMNDQLNPVKYSVLPGKRRRLLEAFTRLSGDRVDFIAQQEAHWRARARKRIRLAVSAADLVVTRDFPSRVQLQRCGVNRPIIVGADSALRMPSAPLESLHLSQPTRELLESDKKKVALCISAQRPVTNRSALTAYLDRVVKDDANRLLFIPMNPVTDAALMTKLHQEMKHPERAQALEGCEDPDAITAIAGKMDVVVASRLHLLILASIAHVPLIGIARGSKVDNFLQPFGLRPTGSVEDCDFPSLWKETERLLAHREQFEVRSREVRAELLSRLDEAEMQLAQTLSDP